MNSINANNSLFNEFSKYGKIERIQTFECLGNTMNALITYCDPIEMSFAKNYRGTILDGNRICATALAERNCDYVNECKYAIAITISLI